jgi:hypothetical protein
MTRLCKPTFLHKCASLSNAMRLRYIRTRLTNHPSPTV